MVSVSSTKRTQRRLQSSKSSVNRWILTAARRLSAQAARLAAVLPAPCTMANSSVTDFCTSVIRSASRLSLKAVPLRWNMAYARLAERKKFPMRHGNHDRVIDTEVGGVRTAFDAILLARILRIDPRVVDINNRMVAL